MAIEGKGTKITYQRPSGSGDPAPIVSGTIASGTVTGSGVVDYGVIRSGQVKLDPAWISTPPSLDQRYFIFFCELVLTKTEQGLIQALRDDSGDEVVRNAYYDFLEEAGRYKVAELVKGGWVPGK